MSATDVTAQCPIASAVPAAPRTPVILLGIGLGGFIDGIVLHQLLRWHHMLTATGAHSPTTVDGLNINTVADGSFHVGTWLLVVIGSAWSFSAWRAGRPPPAAKAHAGLLLAGWGGFNLAEGLIDHQILGIHHVRDDLGGPLSWDIAFLIFGMALLVVGAVLARDGSRRAPISHQDAGAST